MLEWLLSRMSELGVEPAIIWEDQTVTFRSLRHLTATWEARLVQEGIEQGLVVALDGEYTPNAVALLLALIARSAVIVPLTSSVREQKAHFMDVAEAQVVVTLNEDDGWQILRRDTRVGNPLTVELTGRGRPGLVLFSSGSTGQAKAALHDFTALLEKFKKPRPKMRTLTFLLLDHIGGINTLFYALSSGGTVVCVKNRDPEIICAAIERHKVELLPTSPTFLNLMLMSESYKRYDLSSLRRITYGTEVMLESTLKRLHGAFANVVLQQTYGLSEVGILRSKSKESDSLWMRVGGEGFETKVVDGTLWVRAQSAMMGYLNAPSPFDADGWMNTQDIVQVDGDYLRVLGRRSEIINVGGLKVYPAEIESVLMQIGNIRDVTVYGEPNLILGTAIVAVVNIIEPEDQAELRKRLRSFCKGKLARYKIPMRVEISEQGQYSARYKKMRRAVASASDSLSSNRNSLRWPNRL